VQARAARALKDYFDRTRCASIEYPQAAMTWDFTAQVLELLKSHDPTGPLGDLRVKRVYVSGCT